MGQKGSAEAFVEVPIFQGVRSGYFFGSGLGGVGYYHADYAAVSETDYELSATYEGPRAGWFYGTGPHGLGYYRSRTTDSPPEFIYADRFVGRRPGYVFRYGYHGTGYYFFGRNAAEADPSDEVSPTPPPSTASGGSSAACANTPFIPSEVFTGSMPGYVFQRGVQGLGYYIDASLSSPTPLQQSQPPPPPPPPPLPGVPAGHEFIPADRFEGSKPGFVF
jgi:hypothetical protein